MMRLRPFARALGAAFVLAACVPSWPQEVAPAAAPAVAGSASQQARALFDSYWERTARFFPEWATYRGDPRFGDRLNDGSPEADARWYVYLRELRGQLTALPREQLAREERLSVDVLLRNIDEELSLEPFPGLRSMNVGATAFPFQTAFMRLLEVVPVATEAQARQVLARMRAYPQRMAQQIARMRAGQAQGWVPPKAILAVVLEQLDAQLAKTGSDSRYFGPFQRLGPDIPEATREALKREGAQAVDQSVLPAIRQLRDFVAGEYLRGAPERVGLSQYPDGARAYAALVRIHTTTDLTPDAIHRIGLEQVAKAQREMDAVRREVGFAGDMAAFVQYLHSDPRFFKRSGDEVLAGYRDITKRVDPELPRLFAVLPRATYGVRGLPDFLGPGAAESYSGPSLDGTRPGWFNANTVGFAVRPVWGMEAIALHEAVPGHHLQWARAVELEGLPAFRRATSFTAYSEGWGLYAETLGPELGLYRDPYSRFGFQANQAWRAARLVVDTGLHAKGWTREQAVAYLETTAGMDHPRAVSEVDRYISWPGQALAYMIGELKILELRERARQALGPRFDLRRFHMVLLDEGQLPLDLLAQVVDEWIVAQGR